LKYPPKHQLGTTIRAVGNFIALLCLILGTALPAYVPGTLEQRIGGSLFLGVIPALGLYMGGHVLSRLFAVCEWLGEMIAGPFCRHVVLKRTARFVIAVSRVIWHSIEHLYLLIYARWGSDVPSSHRGLWRLITGGMLLATFGLGWLGGDIWFLRLEREDPAAGLAVSAVVKQTTGIESGAAIDTVVDRIIGVESDGDPNATNKRSSALGLGQFLDETWLDLIRAHRPDLSRGRSKDETLQLRRDANLAREITLRFTKQNAEMLRKKGLPVTPGTLYLAHFAGGAGAVAILSALDDADAASVMANADVTGRTKREKIIQANSFLERFTVVDLKSWADRKMRLPGT
jgi:hypothetical protein